MAKIENEFGSLSADTMAEFDLSVPDAAIKQGAIAGAVKAVGGAFKPIVRGVGSGVQSELRKKFARSSEIVDEGMQFADDLRSIGRDFSSEVSKNLNTLKGITLKMMPFAKKVVPGKLYSAIENKLRSSYSAPDERSAAEREAHYRTDAISRQLAEVFSAQNTNTKGDKIKESANRKADLATSLLKFKAETTAFRAIDKRLLFMNNFAAGTLTAYMKKSLEIKYRHLYIAKDTLNAVTTLLRITEARLLEIKQNTGLPDYAKQTRSTEPKAVGSWKQKTPDSMSSFLSRWRSQLTTNIREATVNNLKSTMGMFLPTLGMAGDMMDPSMVDAMGLTKKSIAGTGTAFMVSKVAEVVLNKLIGGKRGSVSDIEDRANIVLPTAKMWASQKADDMRGRGGVIGWLADLFPQFSKNSSIRNTLLNSGDDVVPFDNTTRLSIVEIIPAHLERIGMYMEGLARNLAPNAKYDDYSVGFNVVKRKLTNVRGLVRDYRQQTGASDRLISRSMADAVGAAEGTFRTNKDEKGLAEFKTKEKDFRIWVANLAFDGQRVRPELIRTYWMEDTLGDYGDMSYIDNTFQGVEDKAGLAGILTSVLFKEDGTLDTTAYTTLTNAVMSHGRLDAHTWIQQAVEHHGMGRHFDTEGIYNRTTGVNRKASIDILAHLDDKDRPYIDTQADRISTRQKESSERDSALFKRLQDAGVDINEGSFTALMKKINLPAVAGFIPNSMLQYVFNPLVRGMTKVSGFVGARVSKFNDDVVMMPGQGGVAAGGGFISKAKAAIAEARNARLYARLDRIDAIDGMSCYIFLSAKTGAPQSVPVSVFYDRYEGGHSGRGNERPPRPRQLRFPFVDLTNWNNVPFNGVVTASDDAKKTMVTGAGLAVPGPLQFIASQITTVISVLRDIRDGRRDSTKPPTGTYNAKHNGQIRPRKFIVNAPLANSVLGAKRPLYGPEEPPMYGPEPLPTTDSVTGTEIHTTPPIVPTPREEARAFLNKHNISVKSVWNRFKGVFNINRAQSAISTLFSESTKNKLIDSTPEEYRDKMKAILDRVGDAKDGVGKFFSELRKEYGVDTKLTTLISTAERGIKAVRNPEERAAILEQLMGHLHTGYDAAVNMTQPVDITKSNNGLLNRLRKTIFGVTANAVDPTTPTDPTTAAPQDAATNKVAGSLFARLAAFFKKGSVNDTETDSKKTKITNIDKAQFEGEPDSNFHRDFRIFAVRQLAYSDYIANHSGGSSILGSMGGLAAKTIGGLFKGGTNLIGSAYKAYGNIVGGGLRGAGSVIGGLLSSGLPSALVSSAGNVAAAGIGGIGRAYQGLGSLFGGLLSGTGSVVGGGLSGAGSLLGGGRRGEDVMGPPTMFSKLAASAQNKYNKTFGPKYIDLFIKDQIDPGSPLLSARRQREGVYYDDGSIVKNSRDITQPVYAESGGSEPPEVLITNEDLKKGLVDSNNKPLIVVAAPSSGKFSFSGFSGKGLLGTLASGGLGILGGVLSMYGGMFSALGGGLKIGAKVTTTVLGRLFGIDATGTGKYQSAVITRLDKIIKLIDPTIDAGSAEDQFNKLREKLDGQENNTDIGAKKVSGLSKVLGGLSPSKMLQAAKDKIGSLFGGAAGSAASGAAGSTALAPASALLANPYFWAIIAAATATVGVVTGIKASKVTNTAARLHKDAADVTTQDRWVSGIGTGVTLGLAPEAGIRGTQKVMSALGIDNDNRAFTKQEVVAFRRRMRLLIEHKDVMAAKRLSDFDDALTDRRWSAARRIMSVTHEALLIQDPYDIMNNENTALTQAEVDSVHTRLAAAIKQGNKQAERTLIEFDAACSTGDWRRARYIAKMPGAARAEDSLNVAGLVDQKSSIHHDNLQFNVNSELARRWRGLVLACDRVLQNDTRGDGTKELKAFKQKLLAMDTSTLTENMLRDLEDEFKVRNPLVSLATNAIVNDYQKLKPLVDRQNTLMLAIEAALNELSWLTHPIFKQRLTAIRSAVNGILLDSLSDKELDIHEAAFKLVIEEIRTKDVSAIQYKKGDAIAATMRTGTPEEIARTEKTVDENKKRRAVLLQNIAMAERTRPVGNGTRPYNKIRAQLQKYDDYNLTSDHLDACDEQLKKIAPQVTGSSPENLTITNAALDETNKTADVLLRKVEYLNRTTAKQQSVRQFTLLSSIRARLKTDAYKSPEELAKMDEQVAAIYADLKVSYAEDTSSKEADSSATPPETEQPFKSGYAELIAGRIKNNRKETAVSLDRYNKIVGLATGSSTSVDAVIPKGGTVIHNHPDGSAISTTDIESAARGGARSVMVATPDLAGPDNGRTRTNVVDKRLTQRTAHVTIDAASLAPLHSVITEGVGIGNNQLDVLYRIADLIAEHIAVTKNTLTDMDSRIVKASVVTTSAMVDYTNTALRKQNPHKPAATKPAAISLRKSIA